MKQFGADPCQKHSADPSTNYTDQKEKHSEALTKLRQWRVRISTGGMDQILPGLFVGGLREAMNVPLLSENGIRAVVSVHGFSRDCDFGPDIASLRLALSDSSGENIMQHFPAVNSFVHAHRLKNENVLVHCLAGVSRSVCLCLAYLMTVTNLDYPSAMNFVCRRHFSAKPNFGFKMQLIKFGQLLVRTERQRLFAEFAHFAGQLNEKYRNDCIFTNSLYLCGSGGALFVADIIGTDGQQQKQEQQRHGEESKKSRSNHRHHPPSDEPLGGQQRHGKGTTAEGSRNDSSGDGSTTSNLAPPAAEGGGGGTSAEGGTTDAPFGGENGDAEGRQ